MAKKVCIVKKWGNGLYLFSTKFNGSYWGSAMLLEEGQNYIRSRFPQYSWIFQLA